MFRFFAVGGLFGLMILWLVLQEIKIRRWMKAYDLHDDMFKKYLELIDDPTTTDSQLKEWLPIFEAADKICAQDCPDMKFTPLSSRIRMLLIKRT